MPIISHYKNIKPYITQDDSEIRELMHPDVHGNQLQSLAEAIVRPGETTQRHLHEKSEELYFILQGTGEMQLGNDAFTVNKGDTICIPPGTIHCIENRGESDLKILCCCAPAYSHADTIIKK